MVVLSQPLLTSSFAKLVALGNRHVWIEPRSADLAALTSLRGKVALARRFFRMFRFLEAFHAAHLIYTSFYASKPALTPTPVAPLDPAITNSPEVTGGGEKSNGIDESQVEQDQTVAPGVSPDAAADTDQGVEAESTPPAQQPKRTCNCKHHHHHHHHHGKPQDPNKIPVEAWLDIFSRTFNGMYLLLETLTLVDALELPGLRLWGLHWTTVLHVEGQRFWFFSLLCGLTAGLVKVVKLVAYGPVPQTGEEYWAWERKPEAEMEEWEKMREKMRRFVHRRREGRKAWKREIRTRGFRIARRCVADLLDLALPGSVVGWVRVQPGTMGLAMVVSTWLTGLEIWERCGG
ncbi:hypothetical protein M406DRAFT_323933 [Cryphonectria parasitica EP155]|uniref:Uncharacterized protein n=1 Tax=Cryphonectria parasitica (strain ATCC 38755 / EP155) TaxID=660469 RepID=A0A9P4XUN7_CRYP1|nr:uncharacterized protein M406DRAFT_323933 [Cryphonectria parasitica EP155]KAF3761604.1 hypothetical protein M406DRAFT_323933 [Cryphonectria parasitica EP155]